MCAIEQSANAIFGMMLARFPNPDGIADPINVLWRILGVKFRMEISRVR